MRFLAQFLASFLDRLIQGLWRDKRNQKLGAAKQREQINESTNAQRDFWDKIDSVPESPDDAYRRMSNYGERRRGSPEISGPGGGSIAKDSVAK